MTDTIPANDDLPPSLEPIAARIRKIGAKVLRDAERLKRLEAEALSGEELLSIIAGLTDLKMRFIQGVAARDWELHDRVVDHLTRIRDGR